MYRTIVALLFLFVPIIFVAGFILFAMGGVASFQAGAFLVFMIRLGIVGLGIILMWGARSIYRTGREYLDAGDYRIVMVFSLLMYAVMGVGMYLLNPEALTLVDSMMIPLPFVVWAAFLRMKIPTKRRRKKRRTV